jgi:dTDP-4-dehydrorhamnose 3,5-epimerase
MGDVLIEGVLLTPLRRIANPKGEVLHAIKRSAPGFVGFGEAYFSTVLPGEVKGWKRHRRVTLNLVVPVGQIRFVVHDDRAGSPTRGRFDDVTLSVANYARLTVAPGLWVAFAGRHVERSLVLSVIDEEHDPAEADNIEVGAFEFPW